MLCTYPFSFHLAVSINRFLSFKADAEIIRQSFHNSGQGNLTFATFTVAYDTKVYTKDAEGRINLFDPKLVHFTKQGVAQTIYADMLLLQLH